MADRMAGYRKLKAGCIHVRCRACGRKMSNSPRQSFDPPDAVLCETVCEKHDTGCGGPEEFYYRADGTVIDLHDDIDYLALTGTGGTPE